jgi:hypothetical protein
LKIPNFEIPNLSSMDAQGANNGDDNKLDCNRSKDETFVAVDCNWVVCCNIVVTELIVKGCDDDSKNSLDEVLEIASDNSLDKPVESLACELVITGMGTDEYWML